MGGVGRVGGDWVGGRSMWVGGKWVEVGRELGRMGVGRVGKA